MTQIKLATIEENGYLPQLVQQNLKKEIVIEQKSIEGIAIWNDGIRVDLTTGHSFYVPLERLNPYKELEVKAKEDSS